MTWNAGTTSGFGRRWARWALPAALAVAAPLAAERVALVIGNGAYRGGDLTELANPGNDARAMEKKLRGLGFEVMPGIDLGRREFLDLLGKFGEKSAGAEAALLFYAGHGMQVQEKNYLIPVDAGQLKKDTDLTRDTVKLDDVLRQMQGKTNLVFLDACRNNLLQGFRGSTGRGLAAVSREAIKEMGGGILIGYAAAPGTVASDGKGENSPYTEALLKHMGKRGVSANDMLTSVKADVEDATEGAQNPWTSASLRNPFFFVPGPPPKDEETTVEPVVTGEGAGGPSGWEKARDEWEAVQNTEDKGVLEGYIRKHEGVKDTETYVKLAEARLAKLPLQPGERFRDCGECPRMVVLPGGSFEMGSRESEEGRDDDEGPVHGVTIPEAFAVGEYEVTREEYGAYAADTGRSSGGSCYVQAGGKWEDRAGASWRDPGYAQTRRDPVVCVSWEDAREYVGWLRGKTGKEYRLLSEAEWEYAARAGSVTRFSYGDDLKYERLCGYGNGADLTGKEKYSGWTVAPCRDGYVNTVPVGRYKRNGFGLYDMHGNAWEWVEDCWNGSYRGAPDDGRAWESGDCSHRVLRGGSWSSNPRNLRSAYRSRSDSGSRYYYIGFRVGRTLTP